MRNQTLLTHVMCAVGIGGRRKNRRQTKNCTHAAPNYTRAHADRSKRDNAATHARDVTYVVVVVVVRAANVSFTLRTVSPSRAARRRRRVLQQYTREYGRNAHANLSYTIICVHIR